jgi:hypothetical protein
MSGTCEVYRLPRCWAPFLTIETLHGKVSTLLSVFAVMHMESPFRNEGQETPSLAQIADTLVECVADDDLLDYGRHFVATRQILWKKDTLEHLQLAGAKEEATALAAVDVGAFVSRMAVRSLQGWFSENWSVYAQPCVARRSQINVC